MKEAEHNIDGTQGVEGSDVFHFIHKKDIPRGKITYAQFYCDIRLQNRVKLIERG